MDVAFILNAEQEPVPDPTWWPARAVGVAVPVEVGRELRPRAARQVENSQLEVPRLVEGCRVPKERDPGSVGRPGRKCVRALVLGQALRVAFAGGRDAPEVDDPVEVPGVVPGRSERYARPVR